MVSDQEALRPSHKPRLLLVGGGHAHWIALERLARQSHDDVEIVLINSNSRPCYSGLVPGVVGGHYKRPDAEIDLVSLCENAQVQFIEDTVHKLDTQTKNILLQSTKSLAYDILSLNVGISTAAVGNFQHKYMPTKPVEQLLTSFDQIGSFSEDERENHIGIVGAGAAGVELALQLSSRYPAARIHLVYRDERVLPQYPLKASQHATKILESRRIKLYPKSLAYPQHPSGLCFASGSSLPVDFVIDTTGNRPQQWLSESGLHVTPDGFVVVSQYLQSVSHEDIFAAGDIAHLESSPCPKAGVFAVRQGSYLIDNLLAACRGRKLRRYRPQKHFLSILGTGKAEALMSYGPYVFYGGWCWRLKDWIDLNFMGRFR